MDQKKPKNGVGEINPIGGVPAVKDLRLIFYHYLPNASAALDRLYKKLIAKGPCDCCIILKSGSYTKAI